MKPKLLEMLSMSFFNLSVPQFPFLQNFLASHYSSCVAKGK